MNHVSSHDTTWCREDNAVSCAEYINSIFEVGCLKKTITYKIQPPDQNSQTYLKGFLKSSKHVHHFIPICFLF